MSFKAIGSLYLSAAYPLLILFVLISLQQGAAAPWRWLRQALADRRKAAVNAPTA